RFGILGIDDRRRDYDQSRTLVIAFARCENTPFRSVASNGKVRGVQTTREVCGERLAQQTWAGVKRSPVQGGATVGALQLTRPERSRQIPVRSQHARLEMAPVDAYRDLCCRYLLQAGVHGPHCHSDQL